MCLNVYVWDRGNVTVDRSFLKIKNKIIAFIEVVWTVLLHFLVRTHIPEICQTLKQLS